MNNEEWEDYKELSGEITEKLDNTATYESWLIIQEYVDRCQEKNKKYKEVIDYLKEEIKKTKESWGNSIYNNNEKGMFEVQIEIRLLEKILSKIEKR